MSNTLIQPDQTWLLWAVITGWVAIGIHLEQKYIWASKLSGMVVIMSSAILMTNLKVIPVEAPAYDVVWDYVVPLAIPLLLMQCNIKKIWGESGRLLLLFFVGSIGSACGGVIAYYFLRSKIPDLASISGMMTGSYIGGSLNLAALSNVFHVSGEVVSAVTVADNLLMVLYFFVLLAIPSIPFFQKRFSHPYTDEIARQGGEEGQAAAYWKKKEISLKDIAFAIGTTFFIVAISTEAADFFATHLSSHGVVSKIVHAALGNKYLWITTISMLAATMAPQIFGEIKGTQELGTFFIYIFFFIIGVPASVQLIVEKSPLLLVFCGIMVLINMIVTFLFGFLFRFHLEDIIMASNANIGGPTTAAAMAISKGWTQLVAPTMLVGTLGYVIGTYFGIFVGTLLQ